MQIPNKSIESLYNQPQFRVKIGTEANRWKTQSTGIRQGCPLSPYLFIIAMTVLFRDVHVGLGIEHGRVAGLEFTELLYADDTALITRSVTAMKKLLAKIEQCANYFGLNFNKTKCVSMNFHTNRKNRFANGDKVPTQEDTPYLGANISKRPDNKKEVSSRISACVATLSRLQLFWKKQ